jgi:hypothetical protein
MVNGTSEAGDSGSEAYGVDQSILRKLLGIELRTFMHESESVGRNRGEGE